jgi:hypothetical protein
MPIEKPIEKVVETEVVASDSSEKKEEDNTPAPIGNGGTTERYSWT